MTEYTRDTYILSVASAAPYPVDLTQCNSWQDRCAKLFSTHPIQGFQLVGFFSLTSVLELTLKTRKHQNVKHLDKPYGIA